MFENDLDAVESDFHGCDLRSSEPLRRKFLQSAAFKPV